MQGIRRIASWTPALLILGMLAHPAIAAAAAGEASRAGAFYLELDGASVGALRSAEGGDPQADAIASAGAFGTVPNKHPGRVSYSDVSLEVGAGMEPAIYEWIASAWDAKGLRKSGAVVAADYGFNVVARREFLDALIVETALPALDAASKDPAAFTVRLAPGSVRISKGGGTIPSALATRQRPWFCNAFRLEIPGLDCSRVRRIEPIRIGTRIARDDTGEQRIGRSEPTGTTVSDLVITMPESSVETWQDWAQRFLVQGQSDDSQEKSGDLVLLGSDLQSEIARIHLSGLGILGLQQQKAETAGAIRNTTATLYCERASLEWKGQAAAVMNVRVFGR